MRLEVKAQPHRLPSVGAQVHRCPRPLPAAVGGVLRGEILPSRSVVGADLHLAKVVPRDAPPVPEPKARILPRRRHGEHRTYGPAGTFVGVVAGKHRRQHGCAFVRPAAVDHGRPTGRYADFPRAVAGDPAVRRKRIFKVVRVRPCRQRPGDDLHLVDVPAWAHVRLPPIKIVEVPMRLEVKAQPHRLPSVGAQVHRCPRPLPATVGVVFRRDGLPGQAVVRADLYLPEVGGTEIGVEAPPVPEPQARVLIRCRHGKRQTDGAAGTVVGIVAGKHRRQHGCAFVRPTAVNC